MMRLAIILIVLLLISLPAY
ncbi:type I toxin-antitoxin system Ibs family toxin [Escherichia coli]|uniref:Type I toxin-antitoxin system Ibs family toxin n=1 Tax=Escherichia coli TaxID=562 RepID=A0AAN3PVK5_ECOLX|nr:MULTISPECIES: type I toxin-antitoxin system Ibs family toxin [Escherichia]HDQ6524491.1 type I toxin-antitoxin system Ibs family toxin [Escherichia coli O22:H16]EGO5103546.1 type I toxin-antitoxin system Ibs family toxin [Escherichia coli]EGO5208140.1 type I toxin-antitoxin system Ibs family toxin [Escherichia coli]EGO6540623.1 type I toxin-antitoxin system Ibs family toxin [Escherichia coli]EGO6650784.1 type I toxin-antitoxin system Ibs family toxin [Escherichia coli]